LTANPYKLLELIHETKDWIYKDHGKEPGEVDCVGWTVHILRGLGHKIPSYHYQHGEPGAALFYHEYHKYCVSIKSQDKEPGDVVFIRFKEMAHLAIYAGGNRIAHCSKANGVVFQRLDQPPLNKPGVQVNFYRMRDSNEKTTGEVIPHPQPLGPGGAV
jgi:cell wall-associated NlpC family hydrolase